MSARPGRMLEIIATGWGEERGSRVVAGPRFGEITARLWQLLREESIRAMAAKP
jgi:NitT/TauT family transport system ATP-binding protein